jgi:CTP-dependent riboflavin kinase
VREECLQKLDFIPFPGTLNLKVQDEYIGIVRELRMNAGVVLTPPSPEFCQAKCFPVSLGSIKAAIIFPEADRFTDQLHAGNIIEIIAPVSIKRTLSVKDGDELVLELEG